MSIQEEKLSQAVAIMNELDIDMWITLVRESETSPDPVLELTLGRNITWLSAFIITREGDKTAIVGSLDEPGVSSTNLYTTVIPYVASMREDLLKVLNGADPGKIAVNFSTSDVLADGLSHGAYLTLKDYLEGTPYTDRLVSAGSIIGALRGRKSSEELERISGAISITEEILSELTGDLKPGLTEKNVADIITGGVMKRGLEAAWDIDHCPAVFTGPDSAGAHYSPTDREIEPGHVLNVDFGVKYLEYCSDMQRTWYFRRSSGEQIPDEVQRAFEAVRDAVRKASEALEPGIEGWKIDDVARSHITSLGYEEYPHALGHQIGRKAHDGSGLLCPRWERYGTLPFEKVEKGQVYTLEPRATIKDYGVATVEEIVVVEDKGCRFLTHPQVDLWVI
jgi:Xaa-Pro aminopeptidase